MSVERKYERDIDLFLAEEFSVSDDFSEWFLSQTKKFKGAKAKVRGVFVSKSDISGESDLVVLFEEMNSHSRFALHIEDKVNAPFMPEQEARYRVRAESEVLNGEYADYEIVLCTPAAYCVENQRAELFDSRISYESIGKFLLNSKPGDMRVAYRSEFIITAAKASASKWVINRDEVTDNFWRAAYEIATNEFPELEMKELKVTKGSTWINFRPSEMPTYPRRYYIFLKGDRGLVDLTFSGALLRLFVPLVKPLLEPDMTVVKTGNSASIRLEVSPFKVAEPSDSLMAKVRDALSASARLIRFYYKNRQELDKAASESLADSAHCY